MRLIGPCYSLAFIDLFGVTSILNPAIPIGYSLPKEEREFSKSHPADIYRLQQHVTYLVKLGWWPHVLKIKSHYVDVLKALSDKAVLDLHSKIFEFPNSEKPNQQNAVHAFYDFGKSLIAVVDDVVGSLDNGVGGYERHGELVEQYLQNAVAPSTVFDGTTHWYPDLSTLLNASTKFRLESVGRFVDGIENQRPELVGHRSRWMKRLELLTAKAIEDHQLLVAEKGAIRDGSFFKRADLGAPKP